MSEKHESKSNMLTKFSDVIMSITAYES